MNRPACTRLLILSVTIAAGLAFAGTASAVEPTRQTVHVVSTITAPCPSGITLRGVFDVTREITTFYDSDGTPLRSLWIVSFEGTWTNPTNGSSLPAEGVRTFHIDLLTGELFTTGTNVVTKLPDGGVAIGQAGRLVFDAQGHLIEHDGPDTATERAQLCAALGAG